jgi:hypothetical protein
LRTSRWGKASFKRLYQLLVRVQPIHQYREGKEEGKDDAKKGRPANATGHKDYVKSNSIHFREAFIQGYEVGYREKLADLRDKHGD